MHLNKCQVFSWVKFITLIYDKITFNGLTPGERIKKIGVVGLVSSNDFAKSTLLPSIYFAPSFSSMNTLQKYR